MGSPSEIYQRAALSCLGNSRTLCASADRLAAEGAFGLACSLLILGLEEVGKGLAFRMIGDGQARITGTGREQEFAINLPVIGERRYGLYRHPEKRDITFGYELWLLLPAALGVIGILSRAARRRTAAEKESDSVAPDESEGPPSEEDIASLSRHPPAFSSADLERIKLGGLYVDVVDGVLHEPAEYSESQFLELRDFVMKGIETSRAPIERGVIAAYMDQIRKGLDAWLTPL